jgi:hypothetical protein
VQDPACSPLQAAGRLVVSRVEDAIKKRTFGCGDDCHTILLELPE